MKYTPIIAAILMTSLTACQKTSEEAETTEQTEDTQSTGLKIAYVEMDSLLTQYQLYIDYEEELTRKGTNIQSTLAQKQRTLEQHADAMQKKYESNGFTTRDELERAQNSIQAEQQQLQELAARLQNDFANEQARVNQEARDSIQAFLRSYNKTKKYDYVMVKAGDNMLIANPKMDITRDVIKGLNKRYKKAHKTAE